MAYETDDTIVALATPRAPASRGVVRISGRHTLQILESWSVEPIEVRTTPYQYSIKLELPDPLGIVPASLYLWPGSRSYTGEPIAELHTVGALPVLDAMIEYCSLNGARLAEPGEFTLRAFLAGRIDLTQAEAVLGVINAHATDDLRGALRQLAGGIGHPLENLRQELLQTLGHVEAGLDFVEESIDFISADDLCEFCSTLRRKVEHLQSQLDRDLRADEAWWVVLAGKPNVGKSSLLNCLADDELAITASEPGTTRDCVTTRLEWDQVPLVLVDTAGEEQVTEVGVRQAAQQTGIDARNRADLVIWCCDSNGSQSELQSEDTLVPGPALLQVWTKIDLKRPATLANDQWAVSSRTGEGIPQLRSAIRSRLIELTSLAHVGLGSRCRDGLRRTCAALKNAEEMAKNQQGEELVAMELRLALQSLGELTGAFYTEELLDEIFGRFCIGK